MVKMGNVWDRTAEFLGDNLGALVPVALLLIFVPTSIQQTLQDMLRNATPATKGVLTLGAIAMTVLMLWGKLAITAMALDAPGQGQSAVGFGGRRLLPAIGVLFVAGLLLLVLLIPMVAVLAAYGFDFAAMGANSVQHLSPDAKVPLLIVALLTVPAALWLAARLYVLLVPAVVAERRGLGAIPRSFALSRGLALKIVGVLLLFALVAGVSELAAKSVFGSIFELVAGDDGGVSVATVLTSVVVGAISTAFSVLATAFCAKLYLAASGQEDVTLA